tara:strand:- start:253 stop:489 length:237 start_codon:yes stop_codon:yes gene_type:complete
MTDKDQIELIENFKEIFEEIDTSSFDIKTRFKDNDEWDSMCALNLIALLDEKYNIAINGNQISEINTLEELIFFIENA